MRILAILCWASWAWMGLCAQEMVTEAELQRDYALIGENQLAIWPDDWLGSWEGRLALTPPGAQRSRTFPMRLEISAGDSAGIWNWIITYGKAGNDVRRYKIVALDSLYSRFLLDEQNSIELSTYRYHNALVSMFSVDSTFLVSKYRRQGDVIEFEIITSNTQQRRPTGRDVPPQNPGDLPPSYQIFDYPPGTMQRAILRRKE